MNHTKFKEKEIGKIPDDWDVKKIESVVSINELAINKAYPHAEIIYFDISSVDKGQILGRGDLDYLLDGALTYAKCNHRYLVVFSIFAL